MRYAKRSHKAKRRQRQKEGRELRHIAIRLLLGLREHTTIRDEHLDQAEKKLRLPLIRLRLDLPFPHPDFRMARIYRALQKRA